MLSYLSFVTPYPSTLILWGFCPTTCLISLNESFSFVVVLCVTQSTLSSFTWGISGCCVMGAIVGPRNFTTLEVSIWIHDAKYCNVLNCAITHGDNCIHDSYIHPSPCYHCCCLASHFGRIGEFVLDLFKVLNNLHYLFTFIVNELITILEASWAMSSSRLMHTPTFTNNPQPFQKTCNGR